MHYGGRLPDAEKTSQGCNSGVTVSTAILSRLVGRPTEPRLSSRDPPNQNTREVLMTTPVPPACAICQDTGWMPTTKETDSGPTQGVARCECYKRARQPRLLEFARIPARY